MTMLALVCLIRAMFLYMPLLSILSIKQISTAVALKRSTTMNSFLVSHQIGHLGELLLANIARKGHLMLLEIALRLYLLHTLQETT